MMPPTQTRRLTVGARTSRLALWQTNHVIQLLQTVWPGLECHTLPFMTKGDISLDKPLPEIGGKGLFTAELEQALRQGGIDIAVHSLKDLPVEDTPGLTLGAVAGRADVRDGVVARNGWTLATLPPGAMVGTSSLRRQAQLLAIRPDLIIRAMRGNVDTRVRKVMDGLYDAAILAAAGLERLGLTEFITEWLPLDIMLPAPGQGALAVQCRADDTATLGLLAMIDDHDVRAAVTAERAFLAELGSGCSAPVAAYASVDRSKQPITLQMTAMVAAPDGTHVVRVKGTGDDAHALGLQLAQEARRQGAAGILATLNKAVLPLPLQGKRIVVTRARRQAQELCDRLAQLGATPIVLPAIRIAPMPDMQLLDQAIRSLSDYDWVIFTSVNGVEIFWQRLAATGRHSSALQDVRVAAVGPATAQALRQHGVEPDFVPAEFVGQAVIAGLGNVSGLHILLPRAEIAGREFIEKLATHDAVVADIPTYRTLPAEMDAEGLAELRRGVDAITFTSASTVRSFVAAVKDQTLFENALIACIGPVTAETARQLGLNVAIMAAEYTVDGLVQALVVHFRRKSG